MTDERYSGWTNSQTWCAQRWLTNEEPRQQYWEAATEVAWSKAEVDYPEQPSRSEQARSALSERLKQEAEQANPLADAGTVWADLIGIALSDVNWLEIADSWLSAFEGYEPARK
jgi:hypothetical protein